MNKFDEISSKYINEGLFSDLKNVFKKSFNKGIASSAYKEDPQRFLDLIEPYVDGFEQVPFDLLRNEETDLIDRQLRLLDRPIQAAIKDAGGIRKFAGKLVKSLKESEQLDEAEEPDQSMFDPGELIEEIQNEMILNNKWIKFYSKEVKSGDSAYGDPNEEIRKLKVLNKELGKALSILDNVSTMIGY